MPYNVELRQQARRIAKTKYDQDRANMTPWDELRPELRVTLIEREYDRLLEQTR